MKTRSLFSRFLPLLLMVLFITIIIAAGCTDVLGPGTGPGRNQNVTGDLRAYFLDVGQGDSSVILFKDKVILIDAGEIDQGDRVVGDLKKLGITKIDLLVATHPHSDHIGGMQKVLAAFPVGKVLDSGMPSSSTIYENFLRTIDKKNIPYVVAEQGQTLDIDPGLRILVISPPKDRIGDDLNTNSIVLRISYGTVNLLYTSDASTAAEDLMDKAGFPLDARILKVSHHGSSSAGSPAFLSRVRPEVAVISLASDNPYGHPHRETLARLKAAGPVIYRTDLDGTVLVRSNGMQYSVVTETDGGNIWTTAAPAPSESVTVSPAESPGTPAAVLPAPAVPVSLPLTVPSLTLPPVQVGNASSISISETQFNAPGDDRQNLNGEWVRLTNRGDDTILLAGWTLTDKGNKKPYTFPAFILLPETSVTIYTGCGTMNDTSLYMGRSEPVWSNSGDEAVLKDGRGNIIDRSGEGNS